MLKGTKILARHIQSGRILSYTVVKNTEETHHRLLNNRSNFIMSSFKPDTLGQVIEYIEKTLKSEILEVGKYENN